MKYRKLRIAWSVAWGVVAVVLCVLWVRSYWSIDFMSGPGFADGGYTIAVGTTPGTIGCGIMPTNQFIKPWMAYSTDTERWWESQENATGIWGEFALDRWYANAPFWFVCLLTAIAAGTPWFACRFSLRTLLIATTLVAVGLGTII